MTSLSVCFLGATIVYLTLAALIVVRNRRSALNWVCGGVLLCLALWSFTHIFLNQTQLPVQRVRFFANLGSLGWCCFPSLLFIYSLVLTHRRRALLNWLVYVPLAALPVLFSYLEWTGHLGADYTRQTFGWVTVWARGAWPFVYYAYPFLSAVGSVWVIADYRRRSTSARERRQNLTLILSILVPILLGVVTNVALPRLTAVRFPELAAIFGLFCAGGLYYSATRYGLMSFSPYAAADEILSTMDNALVLLTPDNRIVNINHSTQDLFGYRKSELLGRSAEMLFALPGQFRDAARQVLTGREVRQQEITALASNGREIPVSLSARLMRDTNGQAIGSVWVLHDITELRKSEDESRRLTEGLAALNRLAVELTTAAPDLDIYRYLAEQLRAITGAKAAGVSEYDPVRREMSIRHVAVDEGLLAYLNQLLGQSILSFRMPVTPEIYDRMVKGAVGRASDLTETTFGAIPRPMGAAIQKTLGVGAFIGLTFAYRGELLGTAVISFRTGHPLPAAVILHTFANIAAVAIRRRRLEDTLRDSEELYRSVIERANDGIVIIQDGVVRYANPRLRQLWGEAEASLEGTQFTDYLDPDDATKLARRYQQRVAGEAVPAIYEAALRRRDGSRVYAELNAGVITLQDKLADVVIVRDVTERRSAAQALYDSEESFRTLADRANDAIFISSTDGRYVYVNDRAARITGYSQDELLHLGFRDIVRPQDHSKVGAWAAARLRNEPVPGEYETAIITKDGLEVEVESSVARTYWRGALANLAVVRDITERKRAEAALRAERDRAANYLNIAGVIIVALDLNGDITMLNRMGCQLLGYAESELIGRNWFHTCVPDRVRAATRAGFQSLVAGDAGLAQFFENEVLTRDGIELLIAWHNAPLRDDTSRIIGTLSSGTDITAQRRAETARRESDQRYRVLFEHAPMGIYRTTPEGRILMANPALVAMLGYSSFEELAERKLEAQGFEPDYDRNEFKKEMERAGEIRGRETRWQRRDGTLLYVRENALAIRDSQHTILYYEGTVEDVSERKRAEQETRQFNAELEQRVRERTAQLEAANKELESFSYSVSHDLRAPLRGLDGFSQALLDDYRDRLDAQGQDYLGRIRSASQHMTRLIDDLLKLSRVTRGELHIESVNLTELARSVIQEIRQADPLPPATNHQPPTITIASGLQANGDARLLRILLTNLLGNAWKFTGRWPDAVIEFGILENAPTGSLDHATTNHQPLTPVFYVRDNGAGFDMAHSARLFAPFQRLHGATEFPGSGIGLATAHRIVLRHGGRIWAEGIPGQGATFYFTIAPGLLPSANS